MSYPGDPQPPVPSMPPGGAVPANLSPGDALAYGWAKFKDDAAAFVGLVLAVFVATVVASLIAQVVLIPVLNGDGTSFVLAMFAMAVSTFVIMVVGLFTGAGLWRAGLGATRGQRPSLSMLTETTNLVPYLLCIILVAIGTGIGYLFCVVPGIIWAVLTAYAPLVALERGTSPVDAIKQSISWVTSRPGPVLGTLILAYLVSFVGVLVCGVGMLVSTPVALIAIVYSYRALNGESVAA